MLIWINGPFGGGKTATAYELQRRLADSVVCDPAVGSASHVFGNLARQNRLQAFVQIFPVGRDPGEYGKNKRNSGL